MTACLRHFKVRVADSFGRLGCRSHTGFLSPDAASGLARSITAVFPGVPNRFKRQLRARALFGRAAYGSVVAAESGAGWLRVSALDSKSTQAASFM